MKKLILFTLLFYGFIALAFYIDSLYGNPDGIWINECNGDKIIMKNGTYIYESNCDGKHIILKGKFKLMDNLEFDGPMDPCSRSQNYSKGVLYKEGWFDHSTFTFDHPDIDGCDFIRQ